MSALSEVLWSGPGTNTYEDFYFRLKDLKKRFKNLNWTYSPGSFKVNIKRSKVDSFLISLSSEHPGEPIYFTINGNKPDKSSQIFKKNFSIKKTTTIKANILKSDGTFGPVSEKTFYFHKAIGKTVVYNSDYVSKYSGSGEKNLIDGLIGSENHNDGYWQGWEKDDMEIVIDLHENKKINTIVCGFLESHQSWIFLPKSVNILFSSDGKNFINKKQLILQDGENYIKSNRKEGRFDRLNQSARYILITAINRKKCPSWHAGSGGRAWIFSDEIVVE